MAVIKITEMPSSINLGHKKENDTGIIQIDVSEWDALYPGCVYHITVQRPNETGNWPATGVTHADGVLTWLVPNTVTSIDGQGSLVIHCTIGGKEKNTGSCWYFVGAGHDAMGEAPEPVADWIADAAAKLGEVDHYIGETIAATESANTATGRANNATLAANNAAELANAKAGLANDAAALASTKAGEANSAATSANNAAGRADTIAGTLEGIAPKWAAVDISASGLAAGAAPTASVTQDVGGTHLTVGIPKGDKGDKGDTGNVMYATFDIDFDTGELVMTIPDGYTGPTFSINNETGELEVSI